MISRCCEHGLHITILTQTEVHHSVAKCDGCCQPRQPGGSLLHASWDSCSWLFSGLRRHRPSLVRKVSTQQKHSIVAASRLATRDRTLPSRLTASAWHSRRHAARFYNACFTGASTYLSSANPYDPRSLDKQPNSLIKRPQLFNAVAWPQ